MYSAGPRLPVTERETLNEPVTLVQLGHFSSNREMWLAVGLAEEFCEPEFQYIKHNSGSTEPSDITIEA